jgi:adenylate cyclase
MMALFGMSDPDPTFACLDAVSAGLHIQQEHADLNAYMKRYFGITIETRVGIHYGDAVVGQIGHPLKQQYTAIGDSVNEASRIEAACKEAGVNLLVSEAVYEQVSSRLVTGEVVSRELKGMQGRHRLYEVVALVNGVAATWPLAKRVRGRLRSVICRRTGPLILRLVYHDAITFDPISNTGGMNGSIRFVEELSQPENRGLDKAIQLLAPVKSEFGDLSWADLIAQAGAVAVHQAGGPDIGVPLGRADAEEPDPPGRLPRPDEPWGPLRDRLIAMGFTTEELVALCGAHTMGRANGMPFTDEPFHFTNRYFQLLLAGESGKQMLGSDLAMADDEQCREYIEAFALDEELFFRRFASGYRKMTLLGTGL